jgi:hypothetical protein
MVKKRYRQGSMKELQLRYCYAFHLCYNPKRGLGDAITYLQEFLNARRASNHHDLFLDIWCLKRLAYLNHEASGNLAAKFNMHQSLARHYSDESVSIRLSEMAKVGGDKTDSGNWIGDIMRLETWYREAGYKRQAEHQRKRREACEIQFSGGAPPDILPTNVPLSPLNGLEEKYMRQSQNESTNEVSFRVHSS